MYGLGQFEGDLATVVDTTAQERNVDDRLIVQSNFPAADTTANLFGQNSTVVH